MAKVRIHAGDFLINQVAPVAAGAIVVRRPGIWGGRERLPFGLLDTVEAASEESVKRIGGTVGWGLAGGVLLGPVGLLAGLLAGGRGKDITFAARFQDGRRLLGTTDVKTFTRMQAAVFHRKPAADPVAEGAGGTPPALVAAPEAASVAQAGRSSRWPTRLVAGALLLGGLVIAAGLRPPTGSSQPGATQPVAGTSRGEAAGPSMTVARFDPSAMRDPGAVCGAPASAGIPVGRAWRASSSTPGGYVCAPLGAALEIGPAGPNGMPTNIGYFVYGSGERKLDRATLKLNINNPGTADEGKIRLIEAARAVVAAMEMPLPANFAEVVRAQRSSMLRDAPRTSPRVLLTKQENKLVFEVAVEQTRLTSILVHVRNTEASSLW